jgi:hypothetical protein
VQFCIVVNHALIIKRLLTVNANFIKINSPAPLTFSISAY